MLKSNRHKNNHRHALNRAAAGNGQTHADRPLDREIAALLGRTTLSQAKLGIPPVASPLPQGEGPGVRADAAAAGGAFCHPNVPAVPLDEPPVQAVHSAHAIPPVTPQEPLDDLGALWIPQGKEREELPPAVRRAVVDLVDPTYREMVLGAQSATERSLGIAVVRLMWLEIADQHQFTKEQGFLGFSTQVALVTKGDNLDKFINRTLRFVSAKLRIHNFLLRLREQRLKDPSPRRAPNEVRPAGATEWSEPGVRAGTFDSPHPSLDAFLDPLSSTPETTPPNPQSCRNQQLPPKNQTHSSKTEDLRSMPQSETCRNQDPAPKCSPRYRSP